MSFSPMMRCKFPIFAFSCSISLVSCLGAEKTELAFFTDSFFHRLI